MNLHQKYFMHLFYQGYTAGQNVKRYSNIFSDDVTYSVVVAEVFCDFYSKLAEKNGGIGRRQ